MVGFKEINDGRLTDDFGLDVETLVSDGLVNRNLCPLNKCCDSQANFHQTMVKEGETLSVDYLCSDLKQQCPKYVRIYKSDNGI